MSFKDNLEELKLDNSLEHQIPTIVVPLTESEGFMPSMLYFSLSERSNDF